jgi:hypothetical protein
VAHARVDRLAEKLDVGFLELSPRLRDIADPQSDARGVRLERHAVGLRSPESERDVGGLELERRVAARREPERLGVEAPGPLEIARRH